MKITKIIENRRRNKIVDECAKELLEEKRLERGHLRVRYAETCWTSANLKEELENIQKEIDFLETVLERDRKKYKLV